MASTREQSVLVATRLVNVPLCAWVLSAALGGLFYYLDALAPYREVGGYPKDRIEDYCLWLAAAVAAMGIGVGVVALIVIRRSEGRLRGSYRAIIGIVLNVLSLACILFTMFARALVGAMA